MNNIGSLIRQLRKEKRLTLQKLAENLDCDITTISRIELGDTEPI